MAKWPKGLAIAARMKPGYDRVLTPEAVAFVAELHRALERERQHVLALRVVRQKAFDKGVLPDFAAATASLRAGTWKVAPIPHDLQDRRVEIVAPVDRKSVIRALTSGAKVFVADFESATAPAWDRLIDGQTNLMDRWTGAMEYVDPVTSKRYALAGKPAILMVRPRALHANEERMRVDGKPVAAALFDFGLYLFHNARTALAKNSGPYFSLAKLENHLEARLWSQAFIVAQSLLGLPLGTIKASAMIETLQAAFEMDEIIFELRDHLASLAFDSADLIVSFARVFANNRKAVLPDSSAIAAASFPAAAAALLVKTCHRRGCFAIGDLSQVAPDRKDAAASQVAFDAVKAEKEREARDGHDGTQVAHPDLVPVVMGVFNELMPTTNQLFVAREDVAVGQRELTDIPSGARTEAEFQNDTSLAIHYVESFLGGRGVAVVGHRVVDATVAELARSLLWHWLQRGAKLDDGRKITPALFAAALKEELARIKQDIGDECYRKSRFEEAAEIVRKSVTAKSSGTSLTTAAARTVA